MKNMTLSTLAAVAVCAAACYADGVTPIYGGKLQGILDGNGQTISNATAVLINGAGVTNLNADNIAAGTLALSRLSGVNTNNASTISSGTLPLARLSGITTNQMADTEKTRIDAAITNNQPAATLGVLLVTNNADATTEAVNWQTMTGYVAAAVGGLWFSATNETQTISTAYAPVTNFQQEAGGVGVTLTASNITVSGAGYYDLFAGISGHGEAAASRQYLFGVHTNGVLISGGTWRQDTTNDATVCGSARVVRYLPAGTIVDLRMKSPDSTSYTVRDGQLGLHRIAR